MIRAADHWLFIDFPLVFPTFKGTFSTGLRAFWLEWLSPVENLIQGSVLVDESRL